MNAHIKQLTESCIPCQKYQPSRPIEPLVLTEAKYPMEQVGIDLFSFVGQTWLIVVDRFSGFVFPKKLHKTTTSKVVGLLQCIFNDFGYPCIIRSDGGPQFRSEFKEFCSKYESSTSYHLLTTVKALA